MPSELHGCNFRHPQVGLGARRLSAHQRLELVPRAFALG